MNWPSDRQFLAFAVGLIAVLLLAGCASVPPPNVIESVRYVTDWDKCEVVCAPYAISMAIRVSEDSGVCLCKDGARLKWHTDPTGAP